MNIIRKVNHYFSRGGVSNQVVIFLSLFLRKQESGGAMPQTHPKGHAAFSQIAFSDGRDNKPPFVLRLSKDLSYENPYIDVVRLASLM